MMFSTYVEVILRCRLARNRCLYVLYIWRGDLFSIFLEVILVALSQPFFFCRNVFVGVVGWVKVFCRIFFCRPIFCRKVVLWRGGNCGRKKRTPYPNGQGVCELSVLLTCVHRKSKCSRSEPFHPRLPSQGLGSCRPEHGSFQLAPFQCQFGFSLHGQSNHHHKS